MSNEIEKITERFYNDAAGFCYAFTNVFKEQNGDKQKLYPKQIEFMNLLKPSDNISVVVKCRQSGFSTGIQGKALHRAYFGKVPEILITSASMNQSQRVLRKIKDFFESMPEFMRVEFEKYTESQIKLPNGTTIYSLPANADTCRGFTGDVFLDEYGVQSRKDGDELWEALLPCITKGYSLVAVSTPKGKENMFYDLVNPKRDPETNEIIGPRSKRIISVPWWEVPHVAKVIDDFKQSMHPKQFRQEFECEFVDDSEFSIFPYEFLMDNVVDHRKEPIQLIDTSYLHEFGDVLSSDQVMGELREKYKNGIYIGWDVAIADDGSIITVFGVDEDEVWNLIAFKKFPRNTDITLQVRIANIMAQYFCARRLSFDATGGLGLAVETLLKEGPNRHILNPVKFTTALKAQEYSEMRSKMEKGGFRIPKIEECIKEFTLLGHNPVTGRIAAIGSHRTAHDDWPSSFLCAFAGRRKIAANSGFSFI